MALVTLKALRDNIASTVRDTQISDLIDSYINLTASEIFNYHPWTWKRRKTTFSTVASQEAYNLDNEVGEIALMRQLTTPGVLSYAPDREFYRYIADPENQSTGNPVIYRRWEHTGFTTNLAAADTIYVSSSSASDGSSFTVRVRGRNSAGEIIEETLTLNGTTAVTSSTTFGADGLMEISKSGVTTGTVTCYRTTGATTLAVLDPNNLSPRSLRITLYPIPSSAITIYLEYYERFRSLVHNTDTYQMDPQWEWVLREGALAKVQEYGRNESAFAQHQALFDRGLRLMVQQNDRNLDYVPVLARRTVSLPTVMTTNDTLGRALQF